MKKSLVFILMLFLTHFSCKEKKTKVVVESTLEEKKAFAKEKKSIVKY